MFQSAVLALALLGAASAEAATRHGRWLLMADGLTTPGAWNIRPERVTFFSAYADGAFRNGRNGVVDFSNSSYEEEWRSEWFWDEEEDIGGEIDYLWRTLEYSTFGWFDTTFTGPLEYRHKLKGRERWQIGDAMITDRTIESYFFPDGWYDEGMKKRNTIKATNGLVTARISNTYDYYGWFYSPSMEQVNLRDIRLYAVPIWVTPLPGAAPLLLGALGVGAVQTTRRP